MLANCGRRAAPERDAHALRHPLRPRSRLAGKAQHDAVGRSLPSRASTNPLSVTIPVARVSSDGQRARRARSRSEARRNGAERKGKRKGKRPLAARPGNASEQRKRERGRIERRFRGRGEIKENAGAECDREPGGKPRRVRLFAESCCEPVIDERKGNRPRGRTNPRPPAVLRARLPAAPLAAPAHEPRSSQRPASPGLIVTGHKAVRHPCWIKPSRPRLSPSCRAGQRSG